MFFYSFPQPSWASDDPDDSRRVHTVCDAFKRWVHVYPRAKGVGVREPPEIMRFFLNDSATNFRKYWMLSPFFDTGNDYVFSENEGFWH